MIKVEDLEPLEIPSFHDRLHVAMDLAHLTPVTLRDRMNALGGTFADKTVYKILRGGTKNPTLQTLTILAAALGTDVRWFCEADLDGELYAGLSAYWQGSGSDGSGTRTSP